MRHHSSGPQAAQVEAMEEGWGAVKELVPTGWEEGASEVEALVGHSGVAKVEVSTGAAKAVLVVLVGVLAEREDLAEEWEVAMGSEVARGVGMAVSVVAAAAAKVKVEVAVQEVLKAVALAVVMAEEARAVALVAAMGEAATTVVLEEVREAVATEVTTAELRDPVAVAVAQEAAMALVATAVAKVVAWMVKGVATVVVEEALVAQSKVWLAVAAD